MCVIIHRTPGIEIPFDKLRSACIVNPDGMGLAIADRGKVELRRIYRSNGNDVDELAKFLEDNKNYNVFAHLRFRTKGNKDAVNVHPFTVLTKKRHGMDVQFMHNGTLPDFGTTDWCDSKHFAETLLQPLLLRFLQSGMDYDEVLKDPILKSILESYSRKSSTFLLLDNEGNDLKIGEGKQFEGWWASNEYSFNRHHREPNKPTVVYSSAYRGANNRPFNDSVPWTENSKASTKPSGGAMNRQPSAATPRETFCEMAGLDSLEDCAGFSEATIDDLVTLYPEKAKVLIQDLILALYREAHVDESDPVAEDPDDAITARSIS
jgi:predicted glutamine amidotransferase